MNIIFLLIPVSILIAAAFFGAFIWAVKSGQYEDTLTPSMRVLLDDGRVVGSSLAASPHPGPLPRGEGAAVASLSTNQRSSSASKPECLSPSPWGEGRGEGDKGVRTDARILATAPATTSSRQHAFQKP